MKFILIALLVTTFAVGKLLANPSDRQSRQDTDLRCPGHCSPVYDPVCASNGRNIRSFRNRCELERYNCNVRPSERYHVVPDHYCCNFSTGGEYNHPITDTDHCPR